MLGGFFKSKTNQAWLAFVVCIASIIIYQDSMLHVRRLVPITKEYTARNEISVTIWDEITASYGEWEQYYAKQSAKNGTAWTPKDDEVFSLGYARKHLFEYCYETRILKMWRRSPVIGDHFDPDWDHTEHLFCSKAVKDTLI